MQTSTISALIGCSALLSACSSPNGSEPSEEPGAIHGTLRTFVVEGRGPNSGTHHQLRVEGSSEVLELKFPIAPGVVSGTPISVWGEATGNLLNVSRFRARETAPSLAVARQPLTGQPVTYADTMVGVILNLNSGGTTTTTAAVQTWLLGTGAGPKMGMSSGNKSIAQYYNEASYNLMQLTGTTVGPYSWSGSLCNDYGIAMATAVKKSIGTAYDRYIWLYNSDQCPGTYGWGDEGTWSNPQGNVWVNGAANSYWPTEVPHEIGHNYGLQHASSMDCGTVALADDPTTCTTDEYGNPITIMGNSGVYHFTGIEKWYMGHFGGCNGVRVKSSGTFTLFPIESACNGIQTLQIPMPKTTRKFDTEQSDSANSATHYYLELRESIGLDTGITPQVLVHISSDIVAKTGYCARNAILDMKPSTAAFDGLTAGMSYTDPAGGVTFTVNSLDSLKASVTVTLASASGTTVCMDGTSLSGSGPDSCAGNGGSSGTGGSSSTGGATTGGSSAAAGAKATGGKSSTGGSNATGGIASTGGTKATGGIASTGGTKATGGTTSTGGSPALGGASSSGGLPATGGSKSTGGAANTGGSKATTGGAATATGGAAATGGTLNTGGSASSAGSAASGGTNAAVASTTAVTSLGGASTPGGGTSINSDTGGATSTGAPSSSEQGSCSCRTPGTRPANLRWSALGLLAMFALKRRRARRNNARRYCLRVV